MRKLSGNQLRIIQPDRQRNEGKMRRARAGAPKRKHRLLVVEDEAPVQQTLEMFLGHYGYPVVKVATGKEALEKLDDERFDLMILDLILPDMHGLTVLDAVQANHPRLPVIIFTGLGYDEDLIRQAHNRGAAGFVSKQLSLKQLLLEIHRVLDY